MGRGVGQSHSHKTKGGGSNTPIIVVNGWVLKHETTSILFYSLTIIHNSNDHTRLWSSLLTNI